MKLPIYLSKLGTTKLLSFLNPRTNALLKHLNYLEKITQTRLAEIVVKSIGITNFLLKKKYRDSFIETLSGKEANKIISELTEKKYSNPYNFLKGLKFSKNSLELKKIKEFLKISDQIIGGYNENIKEKEIFELKKHESTLSLNSDLDSFYPLFKHQITACKECYDFLKTSKPRVFLHMPTGSGKTRTAINIMCTLLREATDKFIIIWLANKEELCDQAYNEFNKAWQILGNQKIKIFKHFGGQKSNLNEINKYTQNNSAVIFSSLDMMYEDVTRNINSVVQLSNYVRLVVMDEAHLTIAKTYKNIIEILSPTEKTGVLGLSATPGRSYRNVEQDIELKNFYYGQKVSLKIADSKNIISWLVKNEYLADTKIEKILFEADLAKLFSINDIEKELSRIKEGKDYSKKFKDIIANNNERTELLIELIKKENKTGEKIIVFASSKDNATAISDILNIDGIRAASITSDSEINDRRENIEKFKNTKEINILINYDVLTTGFDAPKTKIAIIARPTTSIVLYHQMIGRAVRGPKQGGNKTCKILTVADTYLPGYKDLADSFYFWEDIWDGL